jgi:hypothetical protein
VTGKPPFFILGCVRSGTSFLRDVLRRHPNLACPEETHFFRSAEPFGVARYRKALIDSAVLKKHRELDGIGESEFERLLQTSSSRGELMRRYMRLYLQRRKPGAQRWFDKTPQNVYGAALIAADFPAARFVHIVRDPRDVVASLRVGRVVEIPELIGACSAWIEAIQIIDTLRRAFPRRVHELRHEDLIDDFSAELKKLMDFIDEPFDPAMFADAVVRRRVYDHEQFFTDEERETIRKVCGVSAERYGYSLL